MNNPKESVLIVEDDADLREALTDTLRAAGITAAAAGNAGEALKLLETQEIALVISDVQMPGPNGYELLASIKRLRADLPVVLMTAYGTIAQAVSAMREGATDYIVKPFDAQALIDMARRQLANRVVPNELVAADPESKRTVSLARKIAENDATVLITGESGTGKEVYARFIRDHSGRSDQRYIAINCAAIPENMLEATLFGYEKGAFTGALSSHAGKFEQAQGGTLLLDEISEMDLNLQAKILRVLQEREVERLGSTRSISLDVRLIATSNRDLPDEVRAGRLRADLFYRLNVMSLRLPGGAFAVERRRAQAGCARLAGQCARAHQHRATSGMARERGPDPCRGSRSASDAAHGRGRWQRWGAGQRHSRRCRAGRRCLRCPRVGRCRVSRRRPGCRGAGPRPRPQGARARADPGDAQSHRRQPQARRGAARHQSAHAASQAAAAQSRGRRRPAPARTNFRGLKHMSNMQIQQVLAEMRALQARAAGGPADSAPAAGSTSGVDFASLMKSSVDHIATMQNQASSLAQAYESGDKSVDLTRVMLEVQKADLAFRGMTQVRNKLLDAYTQVMNMSV
jgi:flagellar hook-basal body complex protein FliE